MEYIGEITNYGNGPNPVILTHEHTNEATYLFARLVKSRNNVIVQGMKVRFLHQK